ncbi:hypothetical protein BDN71DRAFT_94529 [Pleurotus eryngii]|uniref:Uncharacterized protein n=1 Tax=Pleurotus eryngii TaxID=5323 RepID=A0A9P6D3J0_PLEER|nr:hypothetical protein BDN71DRAFT_94529 [Pleurotus eryngii]
MSFGFQLPSSFSVAQRFDHRSAAKMREEERLEHSRESSHITRRVVCICTPMIDATRNWRAWRITLVRFARPHRPPNVTQRPRGHWMRTKTSIGCTPARLSTGGVDFAIESATDATASIRNLTTKRTRILPNSAFVNDLCSELGPRFLRMHRSRSGSSLLHDDDSFIGASWGGAGGCFMWYIRDLPQAIVSSNL